VYTVHALYDVHVKAHRREGGAMKETDHQQQAESGAQHGQPTMGQRLTNVPTCKPGAQGDPGGFDATESELLHLLQCLIPLTGENHDQWTWEEHRDFLNWCLDEGVLTIQDGRLVPVGEDMIPTVPLTHFPDEDAQDRAEHAGLVRDVERTKPVIQANSEINAKELADDLGLNSAVYMHTLNMSMNAHKSAQEGAD